MKRLGRIIFNALSMLSLLLCVAMGIMWVQSYSYYQGFRFFRTERSPALEWIHGKIAVRYR